MSVSPISEWRLPGCGADCSPRSHDPLAHAAYGVLIGVRLAQRPPVRIARTGALVIDLDACTVTVNGSRVHLTNREWGVLEYFAEHLGQPCTSDEIVAAVWGPAWVMAEKYQCPGRYTERTHHRLVNVNVNRVRKKLGPAAHLLITEQTTWGSRRRLERVEPDRWCDRDNGPPRAIRCLRCSQVHICRTMIRNCFCPCGSDHVETV